MASYIEHRRLGGLFKTSFFLYSKFWASLASIGVIVLLPPSILLDSALWVYPDRAKYITLAGAGVNFALTVLANFLFIGEISQACFGEEISVSRAFSRVQLAGWFRLFAVTCTMALLALSVFLVPFFIAVGGAAAIHKHGPWDTIALVLAAIIGLAGLAGMIVVFLSYYFVIPVVILENRYWLAAIKRGFELALTSFWRTLWYLSLFFLSFSIAQILFCGSFSFDLSESVALYFRRCSDPVFYIQLRRFSRLSYITT